MTADNDDKAAGREKKPMAGKRGNRGADPHVSNALRNAYEETVSEDVPQEFLDLLGKLT